MLMIAQKYFHMFELVYKEFHGIILIWKEWFNVSEVLWDCISTFQS